MPNTRRTPDEDALRSVADTLLAWLGGVLSFAASPQPGALAAILGPRFLRHIERELRKLTRIAHVLSNLTAYVRRALKRIHKGFVRARILSVQPPTRLLVSSAPTPRAACADTS